ncbi:MAG: hypothetical protein Q4A72_03735 [Bacillota bacterium]|nr:hypothetical protein [Bacillota bacterium]
MKKPMKLLSLVFFLLCILTSANSYAEEVERSRYSQYKQAESDRTVWFSIPHELGIQPFWVRHYSRYEEVYKIGSQNMESGVRSAFSISRTGPDGDFQALT